MSKCRVDDCPNEIFVNKHRLCKRCYDYLRDQLYASPKLCSVTGCSRPHRAKDYCNSHYHRFWRYGNTTAGIGVPAPKRGPRFGKPSYKGTEHGYIKVRVQDESGIRWVLEHWLVMESVLGRKMVKGESVHHKDGNRANNDPANLELWNTKHCAGQRVSDLVEWAREIIRLYGP